MATYVLVAGNWLGGWAWADVTSRLRAAGHDVHPVTLTGLGDRVHLASPEVDLDTHVTDIVHTIEYADLTDVILVGHSYGGFPVTAAADRLAADGTANRLAHLVYVDSGPLPGMSQLDTLGPDARDALLARMKEQENGWREPVPTWAELSTDQASSRGLDQASWERHTARAVDQPLRANAQRLPTADGGAARDALPHTLVTCVFPLDQVHEMIASGHPFFAGFGGADWSFVELPTGHWPMFSEPARLAEILDGIGRDH
jgi:pimeloyl-ACP methyl ester carboxylesterase